VKPHTWRVSMTVAVIASLLLGLAAVGLGVEDLRKINNINHFVAGFNASFAKFKANASVPAATMLLPTNGATVSGVVPLDANPVGTNVSSMNFVASGGTSKNVQIGSGRPTLSGWLFDWTSTSVPNGTYEIAVVAYNSEGKSSKSPAVTVIVNNRSVPEG